MKTWSQTALGLAQGYMYSLLHERITVTDSASASAESPGKANPSILNVLCVYTSHLLAYESLTF